MAALSSRTRRRRRQQQPLQVPAGILPRRQEHNVDNSNYNDDKPEVSVALDRRLCLCHGRPSRQPRLGGSSSTALPPLVCSFVVILCYYYRHVGVSAWLPHPATIRQTNTARPQRPVLFKTFGAANDANDASTDNDDDRQIRIFRAQAEIDRILSGPDAPLDLEREFRTGRVSRVELVNNTIDDDMDELTLEQDLVSAAARGDYDLAARRQEQLASARTDAAAAVLQVHAAFYRALRQLSNMEHVWYSDATTTCIHPATPPVIGGAAVATHWSNIFALAARPGWQFWLEPTEISLAVSAHSAVLLCDEYVYARRFVRGQVRTPPRVVGNSGGGTDPRHLVNTLTSTHTFRKVAGQWYLCHRHASWHANATIVQEALRPETEKKTEAGATTAAAATTTSRIRRTSPAAAASMTREEREAEQQALAQQSLDGLLGRRGYRAWLGLGQTKGAVAAAATKKQPPATFVMGNLQDILGDLLGTADNEDEEEEDGATVFELVEDDEEEDDDEDDEEDSDDDEVEVIVVNDDVAFAVNAKKPSKTEGQKVKDEAEVPDKAKGGQTPKSKAAAEILSTTPVSSAPAPKDILRQNCITTLRKLAETQAISPKQKRVLLTDIITCSARGEFSMIEVAYELLCGGDTESGVATAASAMLPEAATVATQEFADQCRVFANTFLAQKTAAVVDNSGT
jgi:SnoaL-like domain